MRSRLLATLAAALVVGTPVVLAAAPAAAATCTSPALVDLFADPGTLVLGPTKPKDLVVIAAVEARGCAVSSVKIRYTTADQATSPAFPMVKDTTEGGVTVYGDGIVLDPQDGPNADAGTWKATATLSWSGATISRTTSFKLLRESQLATANATPEPVAKGKTLTVTGKLTRADWERATNVALAAQKVSLQLKTGTGAWTTVKTATSSSSGALKATVTASKDGCFRWSYAGTSTTAGKTSAQDCVDVR